MGLTLVVEVQSVTTAMYVTAAQGIDFNSIAHIVSHYSVFIEWKSS